MVNNGSWAVSNSFHCFGDNFPPTGLTSSALLGKMVPNFISTLYAMFGWYSWEVWPFPKRNGERVDKVGVRGKKEEKTALGV